MPGLTTMPVQSAANSTMPIPGYCHHSFKIIKSDSHSVLWECGMCQSGPHWFIFECKSCNLKTCRPCTFNA